MTRLRSSLEPDDTDLTEPAMRRLAASVPRGGAQRHPPPAGESVGDNHDDPDLVVGQLPPEWRSK